jgi:hypothetical protein
MRGSRIILKIVGTAALIFSALLCTGSLLLMLRTRFASDEISVHRWSTQWEVSLIASGGRLYIREQFSTSIPGRASPLVWVYISYPANATVDWTDPPDGYFGFNLASLGPGERSPTIRFAAVPLWFLAVIFGASPTVWITRRRRQYPAGHCETCGYDLRETPQRCPECGAISPAKTEPAL